MPCNARVVVKAKVKVNVDDFLKRADESGLRVIDRGDRLAMRFGQDVTVEVYKTGEAVLRSTALTWDEGVDQLRRTVQWLTRMGVTFSEVGQPETHIHNDSAPWQPLRYKV